MIKTMMLTRHISTRDIVATLLLISALLVGWVADAINNPATAIVFNIGNGAPAEIYIQVGRRNSISRVRFRVANDDVGSGNPVNGDSRIDIQLLIRAPASRPLTGFLTVDSSTPLNNGSGATIPVSEIGWIASSGDIPSGSFTGTSTQQLASFTSSVRVTDRHTFSYKNRNIYDAGTYNGQVTYTWFAP
jgi:hypothetical protein